MWFQHLDASFEGSLLCALFDTLNTTDTVKEQHLSRQWGKYDDHIKYIWNKMPCFPNHL